MQAETDDFVLRRDFVRGIRCLRQFGLTYDILVYARQLPAAVKLVEKFPEQRFVLDHVGKPAIKSHEMDCWRESIRSLAVHPQVYCKLLAHLAWRRQTRLTW